MVSLLATRLSGSADLYQGGGRAPYHSINFVTSHDGFPLADLFRYSRKYNEANGEGNRDGGDDNHSWNCGARGPGAPTRRSSGSAGGWRATPSRSFSSRRGCR